VLVLVRHGETQGNAARQLLGRSESPLTVHGRSQVASIKSALGPVGRLVSSPLGRARDTADALGLAIPVEVDDRWVEVDYGELEGRALDAVPADLWARWRADATFRPPGGESLAEVGARVRRACDELFAHAGEGARADADVVVVSHVSPIKAAVAWALGTGDEVVWHLYLATASITRIGWGNAGPVLHRYNETPFSELTQGLRPPT
jgi:broad specificity phosphatase PhoE